MKNNKLIQTAYCQFVFYFCLIKKKKKKLATGCRPCDLVLKIIIVWLLEKQNYRAATPATKHEVILTPLTHSTQTAFETIKLMAEARWYQLHRFNGEN